MCMISMCNADMYSVKVMRAVKVRSKSLFIVEKALLVAICLYITIYEIITKKGYMGCETVGGSSDLYLGSLIHDQSAALHFCELSADHSVPAEISPWYCEEAEHPDDPSLGNVLRYTETKSTRFNFCAETPESPDYYLMAHGPNFVQITTAVLEDREASGLMVRVLNGVDFVYLKVSGGYRTVGSTSAVEAVTTKLIDTGGDLVQLCPYKATEAIDFCEEDADVVYSFQNCEFSRDDFHLPIQALISAAGIDLDQKVPEHVADECLEDATYIINEDTFENAKAADPTVYGEFADFASFYEAQEAYCRDTTLRMVGFRLILQARFNDMDDSIGQTAGPFLQGDVVNTLSVSYEVNEWGSYYTSTLGVLSVPIQVQLEITGEVCAFSFINLLLVLTSSLSLLAIVSVATKFIIMYLHPMKRELRTYIEVKSKRRYDGKLFGHKNLNKNKREAKDKYARDTGEVNTAAQRNKPPSVRIDSPSGTGGRYNPAPNALAAAAAASTAAAARSSASSTAASSAAVTPAAGTPVVERRLVREVPYHARESFVAPGDNGISHKVPEFNPLYLRTVGPGQDGRFNAEDSFTDLSTARLESQRRSPSSGVLPVSRPRRFMGGRAGRAVGAIGHAMGSAVGAVVHVGGYLSGSVARVVHHKFHFGRNNNKNKKGSRKSNKVAAAPSAAAPADSRVVPIASDVGLHTNDLKKK